MAVDQIARAAVWIGTPDGPVFLDAGTRLPDGDPLLGIAGDSFEPALASEAGAPAFVAWTAFTTADGWTFARGDIVAGDHPVLDLHGALFVPAGTPRGE